MRKQQSVMSDMEIPASRFSAGNSTSRKHRKSLSWVLLIAAFLLTAASAQENKNSKPEQASPAAAPTVRTASGIVRGVTEGDVSSFKGIPYAAAPVGANRWRPPQPLPAWQGERDASKFGADCRAGGLSARLCADLADLLGRLPVCQCVATCRRRARRKAAGHGVDPRRRLRVRQRLLRRALRGSSSPSKASSWSPSTTVSGASVSSPSPR